MLKLKRQLNQKTKLWTIFPLPSRFLQTSLITTGNPHFSFESLPLRKMSMNTLAFRMVMNETQNPITASLRSISSRCFFARNECATTHFAQAFSRVSGLCSCRKIGTATVCQPCRHFLLLGIISVHLMGVLWSTLYLSSVIQIHSWTHCKGFSFLKCLDNFHNKE